jgi:hypothetical protein
MIKFFNVTVAFGDGCPIHTVVMAQTAFEAHEKALKRYPGSIRALVKGVTTEPDPTNSLCFAP